MANSKSLISETKSAVNKAIYNPTKQKKALAIKLLKQQISEIEALKTVTPKKAKKKATKKDIKKQKVQWLVENLNLTVTEATERVERAMGLDRLVELGLAK
jgi:patatin-like phospholipase/acyl hydrolase